MILRDLIKEAVKNYAKKTFVTDRELYKRESYSYRQIYEKSLSICSYFNSNKLKKGDKISVYLPNSSDYASILWACALSGIIAVPIDFNSSIDLAEKISNLTDSKIIFCSVFKSPASSKKFYQEEMDRIYKYKSEEPSIKISDEDTFEIVYTSGTTSEPKGVILTNKNLMSNIKSMSELINFNISHYSFLSLLPLSHLFEQNVGFFLPSTKGSRIVYSVSKKPSAIASLMKNEKIDAMVTVPLFLDLIKQKIISEAKNLGKEDKLEKNLKIFKNYPGFIKNIIFRKIKNNFPNLKHVVSGGAALSLETELFWESLGIEVLQGYGLTETSPVLTCNSRKEKMPASVGKPLSGIEIKIKDNEIIAKGDNIFRGYYKNRNETEKSFEDGWFLTGDLGRFDENGFLFITGRKKNMILSSSGMNIYPEDIERVLNSIPDIKDSVVLGMDNGKTLAGVILSSKKINPQEILSLVNSKLSASQYLSKIIQWHDDDFPRTPSLKIIRRKVEEAVISGKIAKEHVKDELLEIISKICKIPALKIKETSKLISLGLDSVKRIELVTELEEKYSIEFNESLINEKTTVSDLRKDLKKSSETKSESGISFFNSGIFNPLRFLIQELAFLGLSLFCGIKVTGKENLPKENCIIIANHQSMFDTFALFKALPVSYRLNTCSAAAKDFFFKNKIIGFFGRMSFNAFGFSRKGNTKQSLKDFSQLINRRMNVLIYPEGTRSRTGKLAEFKEGIGILEWELNKPIIPIKLKGLYEILPVGKIIPSFGKAEVIIGKPVKFNKMSSPQEITKKLYDMIEKM